MAKRKILVLPGGTRSDDPKYKNVYEIIRKGAEKKFPKEDLEYLKVTYPGQNDDPNELLTYNSALEKACLECRRFQPNWY
jgi:hypothetical protein